MWAPRKDQAGVSTGPNSLTVYHETTCEILAACSEDSERAETASPLRPVLLSKDGTSTGQTETDHAPGTPCRVPVSQDETDVGAKFVAGCQDTVLVDVEILLDSLWFFGGRTRPTGVWVEVQPNKTTRKKDQYGIP